MKYKPTKLIGLWWSDLVMMQHRPVQLCAQYPEKYITLIQPRGVARRRSSVAPQDRAQSRHQMSLNGSGDKC